MFLLGFLLSLRFSYIPRVPLRVPIRSYDPIKVPLRVP